MATPAPASAHVKWTVTGELFHPFAFGVGERTAAIDGGVKSIRSGPVEAVAVLPALSVAVPVSVWTPSADAI